jgi:hypothetical protein
VYVLACGKNSEFIVRVDIDTYAWHRYTTLLFDLIPLWLLPIDTQSELTANLSLVVPNTHGR